MNVEEVLLNDNGCLHLLRCVCVCCGACAVFCVCVQGVRCVSARCLSLRRLMPNENRSLVDYRRERIEILILISTTREWRFFFSPKFCQPTPQQSAKGLFAEKNRAANLVMLAPMLGQCWPMLAPDLERTLDTVIFFLRRNEVGASRTIRTALVIHTMTSGQTRSTDKLNVQWKPTKSMKS